MRTLNTVRVIRILYPNHHLNLILWSLSDYYIFATHHHNQQIYTHTFLLVCCIFWPLHQLIQPNIWYTTRNHNHSNKIIFQDTTMHCMHCNESISNQNEEKLNLETPNRYLCFEWELYALTIYARHREKSLAISWCWYQKRTPKHTHSRNNKLFQRTLFPL